MQPGERGGSWTRKLLARWFGERAEREAARFLRGRGMRVLTRGYRCAQGEIDIIVRDGDVVVFVEVKARRSGEPAEAVGAVKQRRMTLAALHFLKRHELLGHACRFDVVAITWPESAARPVIEHYRDAFEAVGRWQFHR